MSELILCVSQDENLVPYQFKMTGINVWSVEEAAYHCFHYWKHSIEEFTGEAFLDWVRNDLALPFMASKIMAISQSASHRDRLIAFLNLFDFFDEIQLAALKTQLAEWERRRLWERLKEQGDYQLKKGEPAKALLYYKKIERENDEKALAQKPFLLNNMGLAYMALRQFPQACACLDEARAMAPTHVQLLLNGAEAAIYNNQYEKARAALREAEGLEPDNPDIQYLYGELNFMTANVRRSIACFERAIALDPDEQYIFRLTDVYVKLRQPDKAVETLERLPQKGKAYLTRLAELHDACGNLPAAIRTLERALVASPQDAALWTKLASYHRRDYDLQRAGSAVIKALQLDRESKKAQMEHARIKKAMGRTKEYQAGLHTVLNSLKAEFREHNAI